MCLRKRKRWSDQTHDFQPKFNGQFWEVSCKWKREELQLNSVVSFFDEEINPWIREGILRKGEIDNGSRRGIIPLMAFNPELKNEVSPLLDFRRLNGHIESHTGEEITSCDETLRK